MLYGFSHFQFGERMTASVSFTVMAFRAADRGRVPTLQLGIRHDVRLS